MCCTYLNLLPLMCVYCNNSFLGSKCITRNVCLLLTYIKHVQITTKMMIRCNNKRYRAVSDTIYRYGKGNNLARICSKKAQRRVKGDFKSDLHQHTTKKSYNSFKYFCSCCLSFVVCYYVYCYCFVLLLKF